MERSLGRFHAQVKCPYGIIEEVYGVFGKAEEQVLVILGDSGRWSGGRPLLHF